MGGAAGEGDVTVTPAPVAAAAWAALSLDDQIDALRSHATAHGRALSTAELNRALALCERDLESSVAKLDLPPMQRLDMTAMEVLSTAPRRSVALATGGALPTGSGLTAATPEEIEDEHAVRLEALERASLELEEQRAALQRAAQAAARREARRAETAELVAQELADLQAVLEKQEPPGPAVVRIARERNAALADLLPAQRRVAELEEDLASATQQIERLRVRNAALLDRERRRRGVG